MPSDFSFLPYHRPDHDWVNISPAVTAGYDGNYKWMVLHLA